MPGAVDQRRRSFLLGKFAEVRQPAGPPVAVIGSSCLALRGIACMSCRDGCPSGAVRFELAPGGARPRIEAERCTACGECSQACPADAIRISAPGGTS
jgi:ferredoxin-type protein NapF